MLCENHPLHWTSGGARGAGGAVPPGALVRKDGAPRKFSCPPASKPWLRHCIGQLNSHSFMCCTAHAQGMRTESELANYLQVLDLYVSSTAQHMKQCESVYHCPTDAEMLLLATRSLFYGCLADSPKGF
jgi:hypothetical protein